LDAKAQAHKTSAYKFDKLESMCEFNSGKFMFFENDAKDVMDVVDKIETEVKEIKETNQFILPESIRYEFTFTYSTNIFLLVKKIQSLENTKINHLKNIVQQLSVWQDELVQHKDRVVGSMEDEGSENGKKTSNDSSIGEDYIMRTLNENIRIGIQRRDEYVMSIMEDRKQYFNLDEQFNQEIEKHIRRANTCFIFRLFCCDWLKS
jgi:hypothetical protein